MAKKREPDWEEVNDWIEMEAIKLVGSAAVYAQYNKWKELEHAITVSLQMAAGVLPR